ncbi:hypothetical protein DB32_006604 [Sandaracinus amylolyticus]|uniref:Uncharacterized protein n=1 Tax=Sandaracinus amylolyticus TaxID=927083 RepID=A0A0F6W7K5_9BACT|nr:hypothetical protein DB32_006604 [Sandaracinus amylolyticus]
MMPRVERERESGRIVRGASECCQTRGKPTTTPTRVDAAQCVCSE